MSRQGNLFEDSIGNRPNQIIEEAGVDISRNYAGDRLKKLKHDTLSSEQTVLIPIIGEIISDEKLGNKVVYF